MSPPDHYDTSTTALVNGNLHSSSVSPPGETTDEDVDLGTLERRSKRFRIDGKWYIAREATEDQVIRYKNDLARYPKLADGEIASMGAINDAEPFLVHLCLYEKVGENEERERNVPIPIVRGWLARIVQPIIKWLREVSGLEEDETEAGLTKQQKRVEKKLAKLREGKPTGAFDPNSPPDGTTPTSP